MNQPLPDDLLVPSLGRARGAAPPLSSQATFLVSFFGGGVSAGLVGLYNARALLRPRWDWALGALAIIGSLILLIVLMVMHSHETLPDWISLLGQGKTGARRVNQAFGVAAWGAFALLQRKERLAQALSGQTLTRSWIPVLIILVAGLLLNIAATAVGARFA